MEDTENTSEIMYESNGKTPNGKPFLTVKKARGYYEYSERGGQDSIFFVLYDRDTQKWALINESKPPMDEREGKRVQMTTAFGGSIDMNDYTPQEICQVEVLEEAGYEVPLERIMYVGKTLVSSQMSQIAYGYLVDVTGIEKTHKTEFEHDVTPEQAAKDATEFSRNSVVWMSDNELIENSDWKSIFIFTKSLASI
jgi:hypothetical protein